MSAAEPLTFVDTDVLVYAHDRDAGEKHETAARLLRKLWESQRGLVSTQVLQEFYVTTTRKLPRRLPGATARDIVAAYEAWKPIQVTLAHIVDASSLEQRHQLSFWDALVVTAARGAGATRLLSGDLNAGQRIAGLTIVNPFAETRARP